MIRLIAAIAIAFSAMTAAAHASSVANIGTEEAIIIVTIDGTRQEMSIPGGATLEMCATGCFLSNAAGEMMVLKGDERVVLENDKIRILQN